MSHLSSPVTALRDIQSDVRRKAYCLLAASLSSNYEACLGGHCALEPYTSVITGITRPLSALARPRRSPGSIQKRLSPYHCTTSQQVAFTGDIPRLDTSYECEDTHFLPFQARYQSLFSTSLLHSYEAKAKHHVMAKNVSHQVSGKDMQTPPHKNSQPHTRSSANKRSKKPMKSNITNKVKSRHSAGLTPDESQDDDGEGGSSAIEESKSSAGEPDVTALSGAHQHVVGGAGTRLAGHDVDDEDMFNDVSMSDDGQAVGGASENDGSDDEGYNDLDDVSDSEGSEDEAGESGILRSAEQDLIERVRTN